MTPKSPQNPSKNDTKNNLEIIPKKACKNNAKIHQLDDFEGPKWDPEHEHLRR